MIQPYEITIGSLLRTNKGEIIRVESISTKRQHRKVGYHTPNDPYHIKYVRLAQCEVVELTSEILEANGFRWMQTWASYFLSNKDKKYVMVTNDEEEGFGIHSTQIRFHYVHQLQFILITAGLPELAMKLKVE